jgi:undecaprenyl-diphosphatase
MSLLTFVQMSDTQVSLRLYRWSAPRWFRRLMLAATRLGDGWLWPMAAAVLLAARHSLQPLVLAAALANLALIVLKRCCQRRRPADLGLAVGSPRFAPELLAFDRFSFPSGHSLNAFAVATTLALHFPLATPLLFLLASSVAASRLFLGRHFLGDVLAGALVGATIALLVARAWAA